MDKVYTAEEETHNVHTNASIKFFFSSLLETLLGTVKKKNFTTFIGTFSVCYLLYLQKLRQIRYPRKKKLQHLKVKLLGMCVISG